MIRIAQMRTIEGITSISVFDLRAGFWSPTGGPATRSWHQETSLPRLEHHIRRDRSTQIRPVMSRPSRSSASASVHQINNSLAEIVRQQKMSYLISGGLLGAIFIIKLVLLNFICPGWSSTPSHPEGRHAAHEQRCVAAR
jgi:hypothetical protein